ncbi:hypothetical protein BH23PLA1_BH23PLA1_27050 [soil metagenome]
MSPTKPIPNPKLHPISLERLAENPRRGRLPGIITPAERGRPGLVGRLWGRFCYHCRLARVQIGFRWVGVARLPGWLTRQRLRVRLWLLRIRYRRLLATASPTSSEAAATAQPLAHRLGGEVA